MLKSECSNKEFPNSSVTANFAKDFRTIQNLLIIELDYNSLHASVQSKVNILSEKLCHRNQERNFSLRLRSPLMSTSALTKYTLGVFECASACAASHNFLKMTKWSIC